MCDARPLLLSLGFGVCLAKQACVSVSVIVIVIVASVSTHCCVFSVVILLRLSILSSINFSTDHDARAIQYP